MTLRNIKSRNVLRCKAFRDFSAFAAAFSPDHAGRKTVAL